MTMVHQIFKNLKEKILPAPVVPNMIHVDRAPHYDWEMFPIGLTAKEEVIFWEPNHKPHLLLTGSAGSGKSMLISNLVLHTLTHADRWNVVGIDLSRGTLSQLEKYNAPNILSVAHTVEDGLEACKFVREEMMDRYQYMEDQGVNNFLDLENGGKSILFVIDAAASFLMISGANTESVKAEDEMKSDALTYISDIARLGRAAGIHIVLSTQRPDRTVINGELFRNFTTKIVMGKVDSIHSLLAVETDAAAKIDGTVKGRGYFKSVDGDAEFQSYFVSPDRLEQKINEVPNGLDGSGNAVYWNPSAGK